MVTEKNFTLKKLRQSLFWFTKIFKCFTKFQPFEDMKILIFLVGGGGTKFCSKDMKNIVQIDVNHESGFSNI